MAPTPKLMLLALSGASALHIQHRLRAPVKDIAMNFATHAEDLLNCPAQIRDNADVVAALRPALANAMKATDKISLIAAVSAAMPTIGEEKNMPVAACLVLEAVKKPDGYEAVKRLIPIALELVVPQEQLKMIKQVTEKQVQAIVDIAEAINARLTNIGIWKVKVNVAEVVALIKLGNSDQVKFHKELKKMAKAILDQIDIAKLDLGGLVAIVMKKLRIIIEDLPEGKKEEMRKLVDQIPLFADPLIEKAIEMLKSPAIVDMIGKDRSEQLIAQLNDATAELEKKPNSGIGALGITLIVLASVLVLGGIGVGIYFFMRNRA